ncbi:hypothetical protein J7F01_08750 [Streptomyces sp. ISL-22]|uniref:hypothetical protein n=1 Tax=unclassified Streptomyces TaxID=2593676 RepID=UPI001BE9B6E9|nr:MULTISPECIES: hypothetical protein [unclassified Streptomyces]MBT2418035.1 hypothetical protein [Streptomyces sp. ISL-24]MBT2432290.1 hypothetical protein [Streptomyces sp. ISL-22]
MFAEVDRAEDPPVVHRLVDFPALLRGGGSDSHHADAVEQPVHEVRQSVPTQFLGELLLEYPCRFPESAQAARSGVRQCVIRLLEDLFEELIAFGDVERVHRLAELVRLDQIAQLRGLSFQVLRAQELAQVDQHEMERHDPLLPVHEKR